MKGSESSPNLSKQMSAHLSRNGQTMSYHTKERRTLVDLLDDMHNLLQATKISTDNEQKYEFLLLSISKLIENFKSDLRRSICKPSQEIHRLLSQPLTEIIQNYKTFKEGLYDCVQNPINSQYISYTSKEIIKISKTIERHLERVPIAPVPTLNGSSLSLHLLIDFTQILFLFKAFFSSLKSNSAIDEELISQCITRVGTLGKDLPIKYAPFCFVASKDEKSQFALDMEKYIGRVLNKSSKFLRESNGSQQLIQLFSAVDKKLQHLSQKVGGIPIEISSQRIDIKISNADTNVRLVRLCQYAEILSINYDVNATPKEVTKIKKVKPDVHMGEAVYGFPQISAEKIERYKKQIKYVKERLISEERYLKSLKETDQSWQNFSQSLGDQLADYLGKIESFYSTEGKSLYARRTEEFRELLGIEVDLKKNQEKHLDAGDQQKMLLKKIQRSIKMVTKEHQKYSDENNNISADTLKYETKLKDVDERLIAQSKKRKEIDEEMKSLKADFSVSKDKKENIEIECDTKLTELEGSLKETRSKSEELTCSITKYREKEKDLRENSAKRLDIDISNLGLKLNSLYAQGIASRRKTEAMHYEAVIELIKKWRYKAGST